MEIEYINKKHALLNFFSGVLKGCDIKNYEIFITTPFGTLSGTPDFRISDSIDDNLKFDNYLFNHNLVLSAYTNTIEKRLVKLANNPKISIEDEVFFPLISSDDVIVFNNVTLNSNGKTFHLPSFTLFTENILGISYIKK